MSSASRFSLVACLTLILLGALSVRPIITLGPIQPHLLLIGVIVLGFFTRNGGFYSLLVVLAATLARATPTFFDPVALGLIVAAGLGFIVKQHAVWPDRLGVLLVAAFGSLVMNVVAAPRFIVEHLGVCLLEVLVSAIIAVVLFEILSFMIGRAHE